MEVSKRKSTAKGQPASPQKAADNADSAKAQEVLVQRGKAESKLQTIMTRTIYGVLMLAAFVLIILLGHLFVCSLVVFLQVMMFRELTNVRYKHKAKGRNVPLFRTIQWCWFGVAWFYSFGDAAFSWLKINVTNNTHLFVL